MTDHTDRDEPTSIDQDSRYGHDSVAARRALLTKGGVAAAAAAVAGLGVAGRARAADGDELTIGAVNTGSNTTRLDGSTISVQGGNLGAAIIGNEQGNDGVRGNSQTGNGVRGSSSGTNGVGVYGVHSSDTQSGTGIIGESEIGTAIIARGGLHDVEADGSGRIALLEPGQSGSETDSGVTGTVARDADGNLWYCYATDQWQILAGPDKPGPETPEAPDTSGTFVAIDPVRVFDSRQDAFPGSGLLAPNEERTIPVADGRDLTGAVTTPDAVPDGAAAIAFNVTVTGTTGPNFVSVVPGDAAGYTTSSINWSAADQSVANGSIVRVDGSRQVKVFGGDQPGSAHVILDVTGYFT